MVDVCSLSYICFFVINQAAVFFFLLIVSHSVSGPIIDEYTVWVLINEEVRHLPSIHDLIYVIRWMVSTLFTLLDRCIL